MRSGIPTGSEAPIPSEPSHGPRERAQKRSNTTGVGTGREYDERNLWRSRGWYAIRTHSDDSCCDVIAARLIIPMGSSRPLTDLLLIEVKANKTGGPYKNFEPADRARLIEVARQAGAAAWLSYWPHNRGGLSDRQFIPAAQWPGYEEVAA